MTTLLLVLHLIVTLTLIATVLIQRSEGGGLGIGTTQGMGSFMSGRGTANLLTRLTAILAAIFMLLSLTLAVMNKGTAGVGRDILAQPTAAGLPRAGLPGAGLPGAGSPHPAPPFASPPASSPPASSPPSNLPARPAAPTGPSVPTQ